MDETQTHVVDCVRHGMTIEQAAVEAGRPIGTIRRWLTNGRGNPDGPYGAFARSVDAARVAVPEAVLGDRFAEIQALADSLDLSDPSVRVRLGLARGIARKLDWCEATPTGAAAMAMANLARQYREVVVELTEVSQDDREWLANIFRTPEEKPTAARGDEVSPPAFQGAR